MILTRRLMMTRVASTSLLWMTRRIQIKVKTKRNLLMDESPFKRDQREDHQDQIPQESLLLPPKLDIPWQWVLLGVLLGAFLMNMRPVVIRQ